MLGEHVDVAVVALEFVLESNCATSGDLVDKVHRLSARRHTEASDSKLIGNGMQVARRGASTRAPVRHFSMNKC